MEHGQQEVEAQQGQTSEAMFVVFDVPVNTTADEAARLLNEQYEHGLYIHSIAPWHGQAGIGVRVFAKRATHPRADTPAHTQKIAAAEAALRTLVIAHPQLTVSTLRVKLSKLGHGKGWTWVQETRDAILQEAKGKRQ